ncbi:MAG: HNH endonuclease family protein [Gemmatimonadetes bacterium]|nr:HNH endonuclease family protein [Gemmatimonadota bacterium]
MVTRRRLSVALAAAVLLGGCSSLVAPSPTVTTASPTPATWRGLVIAEETRCSPYNSSDYSYPQSLEDGIISRLGGLYSPYTGECFANKAETDIEHIVARSEAHDSGLCSADNATRRRLSQDLENLTLASPALNRQKGDKDAAEWLPDRNTCWFVSTVIAVKRTYRLTIDRREAEAIDRVLAGCASTSLEPSSCS